MLQSSFGGLLTLVICVLASALASYYAPGHIAWLITVLAILIFMLHIGIAISGRPEGIIIDSRNRVSLSKFQAALWTALVLSALIAVVGWNIRNGCRSALDVEIPPDLLVAMGISAVSLAATPALLSLKTSQDPVAEDVAAAHQTMVDDKSPGAPKPLGLVMGKDSPADASWRDIFRGDEVGNYSSADLSKVQAVLITLVLLGVYAAALWASGFLASSADAKCIAELPKIDDKFVWLLAVSHAGYLAYKVAPHTATEEGSPDKPNTDHTTSDPRNQPVG